MKTQKIGALYHYLISLVIIVAFGVASSSAFPSLPFDPPGKGTLWENAQPHIFPQGWGFFTRSAQEPLVTPWALDGESLSQMPTSKGSNLFGLNRSGRAQGVEVGSLQQQVKDRNWKPCPPKSSAQECAKAAANDKDEIHTITSISRQPTLCGKVVLIETTPVDYVYRNFVHERVTANKYANVNISCE